MDRIQGRVREILSNGGGEMCGFVIDGGLEVHFSMDRANEIAALVSLGSRLEVCGNPYHGLSGDPRLDALFIKNLDSRRSANLHEFPPRRSPEMPPTCSPAPPQAASLAPPERGRSIHTENSLVLNTPVGRTSGQGWQKVVLPTASSDTFKEEDPTGSPPGSARTIETAAIRSVELAYDSLHRTQALLAYIKIVDLQAPDVTRLFEESQRTYGQAISNYLKREYAVANEFAAASGELSRSVEVLISRTLRSDSSPTLAPSPPRNRTDVLSFGEAEGGLARVAGLLARIHWLVQNGTLPSEDRKQVQKIATWSDLFYAKGRRFLRIGALAEASCFINAAEAVAHSAEHVCKQDYIMHVSVTN